VAGSLGGLINIKILAVKVKNSAKVTLLRFNRSDVFLYDLTVSENEFLEVR